jgi:hypothetical protein
VEAVTSLVADAGVVAMGRCPAGLFVNMVGTSRPARAEQVAYLVNVTVRPGYNSANAVAALDYAYGLWAGLRLGNAPAIGSTGQGLQHKRRRRGFVVDPSNDLRALPGHYVAAEPTAAG